MERQKKQGRKKKRRRKGKREGGRQLTEMKKNAGYLQLAGKRTF